MCVCVCTCVCTCDSLETHMSSGVALKCLLKNSVVVAGTSFSPSRRRSLVCSAPRGCGSMRQQNSAPKVERASQLDFAAAHSPLSWVALRSAEYLSSVQSRMVDLLTPFFTFSMKSCSKMIGAVVRRDILMLQGQKPLREGCETVKHCPCAIVAPRGAYSRRSIPTVSRSSPAPREHPLQALKPTPATSRPFKGEAGVCYKVLCSCCVLFHAHFQGAEGYLVYKSEQGPCTCTPR